MKTKAVVCIILVFASFFKMDVAWTGTPKWDWPWVGLNAEKYITRDAPNHRWIDSRAPYDLVFYGNKAITDSLKYIPEKQEVVFNVSDIVWLYEVRRQKVRDASVVPQGSTVRRNRRFVLVNPEESLNIDVAGELQYRIWPHLGMLYVGTAVHKEGWDVELHDELVQGYVDLEKLIRPGDVVGLSILTTGMQRGIELARQAKRLGAKYVIAGNDAAIFRADQVLGIPDHPIDAVATSNSITAVRELFRQIESLDDLRSLKIPGIAVVPEGINRSNERDMLLAERTMRAELTRRGKFDSQDVFVVPELKLYPREYWEKVWCNYRTVFGHKHIQPNEVRNALGLFAQGCTRTGMTDVCSYCGIASVADIRTPSQEYLAKLLEEYSSFGINYLFNTTDSVYEMRSVVHDLKKLGAFFSEGLMIYGRAYGLAHHPELIEEWLALTGGRLLVDAGMDSGDERILNRGVIKATRSGSRLEENRLAIQNVAKSGAHLHYSLIFGSPGETRETCEKSIEFFEWTRSVLGRQLDQCETDIYWLNYGAPASKVFHDYRYAETLAALAGKTISHATWEEKFHRQQNALAVPWDTQEAWYHHFTSITVEEAQAYNAYVSTAMAKHEGAAPGRAKAFKPG